jgi:OHCU decarboxylase
MSFQFFRKRPTAMTRPEFINRFGGVYEHSSWVAEAVYDARLRPAHDGVKAMHAAMIEAVETAPRERKLDLLRAHPDLAGRLAIRGELTPASTREQASARLDACTVAEFDRFQELNAAYRAKFGFPFIMAVRGKDRTEILAAFERRVHNDPEAEFRAALDEVHKIALLRLGDL